MTLTSATVVEPVPPMVSAYTAGWGYITEGVSTGVPASGGYFSNNVAVYTPIYVPTTCVARRLWWANGGTATGNIEAGIYASSGYKPGVKIITSGSVGQSGTNVVQFSDITDTTLSPGIYWLYLSASTTSATLFRATVASTAWRELMGFQEAAAPGSAPSTATPVELTATVVYVYGFSTHTIT